MNSLSSVAFQLLSFVSQAGCNIVAETPNNNRSLFITESILAAFEACCKKSLDSNLFPHQSNIRFQIFSSNSVVDVVSFQIEETSAHLETLVKVQHSLNDSYIADIDSETLSNKLAELVTQLVLHIAFVPDPEQYFNRLFQKEAIFSRAFNFTYVSTSIWNILGKTPKLRLLDWQLNNTKNKFPLRRTCVWNNRSTQTASVEQTTQVTLIKPNPGEGEIPPEPRNIDHLKHHDRKVYSLLNITLWNKASWKATGVSFVPSSKQNPPLLSLALLFHNRDAGKQIFSQWNHELGDEDVEERIRVSIITGIDSDNPAAYRVVIGVNPDWIKASNNSQFILTYRINTMKPKDSKNLNQFVDFLDKLGFYILTPGYISQDFASTDSFWELGILKRQIFIRPAWQIGEHDFDLCGIRLDDKIILPKDVKEPPVMRALAQIRKMRSR